MDRHRFNNNFGWNYHLFLLPAVDGTGQEPVFFQQEGTLAPRLWLQALGLKTAAEIWTKFPFLDELISMVRTAIMLSAVGIPQNH
jgi:hypothetical protein